MEAMREAENGTGERGAIDADSDDPGPCGEHGPILVLGASGFLGRHVAEMAAEQGGAAPVAASRRPVEIAGTRSLQVDLLDAGEPEGVLFEVRPRAVLLVAASSDALGCEAEPELARRLNTEVPERVARWCAAHGSRLVHVSTDLVFGGGEPRAERYGEDDPPSPLHTYGRTKAAGEAAVLEAFPGAVVARLPLLFGPSHGRRLGASDSLMAALGEGGTPTLFTDEWRTPLHVTDAARALVELVDRDYAGVLHLAGEERLTRHELGMVVLSAARAPVDWRRRVRAATRAEAGRADDRPEDVSLDASRARELLETPMRSASESHYA